jgi:CRP-like cAMP-binding protein
MVRRVAREDTLRELPLFSACRRRELSYVCRCVDTVSVEAETIVIHEGQRPLQVVVLIEGLVEAKTYMSPPELMLSGATFGELAALSHTPYKKTLIARERSRLLVIEARVFLDLVFRIPSVGGKLAKAFARNLAVSNTDIATFSVP